MPFLGHFAKALVRQNGRFFFVLRGYRHVNPIQFSNTRAPRSALGVVTARVHYAHSGSFTSGFFFFFVKSCETAPSVLSSLSEKTRNSNICRYNYKGSTFFSVILRPWVLLVRPESNLRPPAWQSHAQATEPTLRGSGNNVLINQLDDWSARMLRKLTRVNALNFRNKVLWKNTKYLIPQTHAWKIYYEIPRKKPKIFPSAYSCAKN